MEKYVSGIGCCSVVIPEAVKGYSKEQKIYGLLDFKGLRIWGFSKWDLVMRDGTKKMIKVKRERFGEGPFDFVTTATEIERETPKNG